MNTLNYKMEIAYLGTPFLGWQKTPKGPSIEESLEIAAYKLLHTEIKFSAASRTDRGVHAEGQAVTFFSQEQDQKKLQYGMQAHLPKEIHIRSLKQVPMSLHPSLDSTSKKYLYSIYNAPVASPFLKEVSWHIRAPLNIILMQKAAAQIYSLQQFQSFKNRCNKEQITFPQLFSITFDVQQHPLISISLHGSHFFYKMARNIVGFLVQVGREKIPLKDVHFYINQQKRNHPGITAPAHGLLLKKVYYGDVV